MIPKLKVCGMRDLQNIQQLVEIAPEYMGFIFYPKSPRYLGEDYPSDQLNIIPASTKKVGVFVNATEEELTQTAEKFELKVLQLHGSETPELCSTMQQKGYTILKAFQMDENFNFDDLNPYMNCCDYFLFDTKTKSYGGSGHKFDWSILEKYNNKKPIFLSGGITKEDVETIKQLNHINIYAVDINSKFEIEPALKNIEMVNDFATALRAE